MAYNLLSESDYFILIRNALSSHKILNMNELDFILRYTYVKYILGKPIMFDRSNPHNKRFLKWILLDVFPSLHIEYKILPTIDYTIDYLQMQSDLPYESSIYETIHSFLFHTWDSFSSLKYHTKYFGGSLLFLFGKHKWSRAKICKSLHISHTKMNPYIKEIQKTFQKLTFHAQDRILNGDQNL